METAPPFLSGSSPGNLCRLLREHSVSKSIFSISTLFFFPILLTPLALAEKIFYSKRVKKVEVQNPVFIIGHWRSGTTFLHYLLAQDQSFYAPTNYDTFVPNANILGSWLVKRILGLRLPAKRPMDDVALHPDLPQEEEFAIANLSPYSFYHAWVFPHNFRKWFRQFVLLKGSKKNRKNWTKVYRGYLKKIQYKAGSKTLLLKNPVNTGRIQSLLKLYPDAKFIYLHRNPTEVKLSTYRMFYSLMQINSLQSFDPEKLKKDIDTCYDELLQTYEEHRISVAPENLVEISYHDLLANPLEVVSAIYDQFQRTGFEVRKPDFEHFIESQKSYKPHLYTETVLT